MYVCIIYHIFIYVRRFDDGTHRSSQAHDGAASDVCLLELIPREHLLVLDGIARGTNLEELHVIAKSSPIHTQIKIMLTYILHTYTLIDTPTHLLKRATGSPSI